MAKQSAAFVFYNDRSWVNMGEGVERKLLGFGSDLMMTRVKFKKGSVGYLHKHPHRQVSYIESGSFEVTIAGEKKVQKAGDCYFVPSDVEHGVSALEEGSIIDVFTPSRDDVLAAHGQ